MDFIALGTGNMFTTKNFHSNFLMKMDDGSNMLVDCGSDIKRSLSNQSLSHKDIDALYISHLHGDHSGGLEYIGFLKYFDPTQVKPKLFISKSLVDDVWTQLKPSMASCQGKILTLNDYFDVVPIEPNSSFIYGMIKFHLVQTFHIMDGYRIVPSFGLTFRYHDTNVFFTSDTQFNSMLMDFYNSADIIIQEVETSKYESGVHCHINSLDTLDKETKEKMYLYHYTDDVLNMGSNPKEFSKYGGLLKVGDKLRFEISGVKFMQSEKSEDF